MSTEENNKKEKINVSIDTKRTEELARENERLKMEKEKKEFDINEKKLEMYEKTGEKLYLNCKTREELTNLTTSLMKETVERRHGTSSGSPLVPQQYGISSDLFKRKFEDEKSMVDEILRCMHSEDPREAQEGKEAYEAFLKKWILDKRSNPTRSEANFNPNTPEALLELDLVQKDGILQPRDKTKGDLGRLIERFANENPNRRLAKKRVESGVNPQEREQQ